MVQFGAIRSRLPPARASAPLNQHLDTPAVTRLIDVRPESVLLYWPGRIPLGELSVLCSTTVNSTTTIESVDCLPERQSISPDIATDPETHLTVHDLELDCTMGLAGGVGSFLERLVVIQCWFEMHPNPEYDAEVLTDRLTCGCVVIKRNDAESEAIIERASGLHLERCHLHLVNSRTLHLDDSSGVAID